MGQKTLEEMTRSLRFMDLMLLPTVSSAFPLAYTSAMSIKLTPLSMAVRIILSDFFSSTERPNVNQAPREISEILRPLWPTRLYFMMPFRY